MPAKRASLAALLAALSLWHITPLQAAPSPQTPPPVEAELLTLGTADELYARFGHAAIRIGDTVYNYGYTEFDSSELMLDFVRGRALFWGEREDYHWGLRRYRAVDRTVIRQRLNLSPSELRRLEELLAGVEQRYVYHHYNDNCATRLRDILDEALGGAIKRKLVGQPHHPPKALEGPLTIRALMRRGFAKRFDLLLATALFLGHRADLTLDSWQAGFLPELLAQGLANVQHGATPLLGPPQIVYQRRGPAHGVGAEDMSAVWALWGVSAALLLLGLLALLLTKLRWRISGLIVLLFALVSTMLALPLWVLAAFSSIPELARNEWALLFWPTDILLVGLGIALLRGRFWQRRWLNHYVVLRLAGLLLFGVAHVVGLLYQRPLVLMAIAAVLLFTPWAVMRMLGPNCPSSEPDAPPGGETMHTIEPDQR
ncbi:MAG: DUF4105 domain-containing protein [Deltaproteobacteria bacterium]|nr:DUF4105 domain-containing protein [Deltaproteobacteria bacterium]